MMGLTGNAQIDYTYTKHRNGILLELFAHCEKLLDFYQDYLDYDSIRNYLIPIKDTL